LPQFVETTSATPVAVQLALLGGVLTVASVVFHGLLGVVGGRLAQALSQRLAQRPALARTQGRVLATVLAALALRLLLTQRPTA
jgi:threonine/homoserine/homoserine lactone efflux protein